MSVLFPKVNKPREWDYRPIYYDEEKEARKEKLARLHHGSFREEYEKYKTEQNRKRKSMLLIWVGLLLAAVLLYYFLS